MTCVFVTPNLSPADDPGTTMPLIRNVPVVSQLDQAVDGWMACSTSTTNTSCACDTRRSSGGFRSALKFYYDAAPSGARNCRLLSAAEVSLGTAALTNWAAGSGEDTHWYARPAPTLWPLLTSLKVQCPSKRWAPC